MTFSERIAQGFKNNEDNPVLAETSYHWRYDVSSYLDSSRHDRWGDWFLRKDPSGLIHISGQRGKKNFIIKIDEGNVWLIKPKATGVYPSFPLPQEEAIKVKDQLRRDAARFGSSLEEITPRMIWGKDVICLLDSQEETEKMGVKFRKSDAELDSVDRYFIVHRGGSFYTRSIAIVKGYPVPVWAGYEAEMYLLKEGRLILFGEGLIRFIPWNEEEPAGLSMPYMRQGDCLVYKGKGEEVFPYAPEAAYKPDEEEAMEYDCGPSISSVQIGFSRHNITGNLRGFQMKEGIDGVQVKSSEKMVLQHPEHDPLDIEPGVYVIFKAPGTSTPFQRSGGD